MFVHMPHLKFQKFFLQFSKIKRELNSKFTYFAFKSSEIRYYLKDPKSHIGLDSHWIFPLFMNKMAVFLAPKLAKHFRCLNTAGSFPVLWTTANLTQIPKNSSRSQFPLDYRTISITPNVYK